MTLLSFHHVTLHRATVEDKALSLKALFSFLKCPKLIVLFSVPKRPKHRVQQHGWLQKLLEEKIPIKSFWHETHNKWHSQDALLCNLISFVLYVVVVKSLYTIHWWNAINNFHKSFLVMQIVWVISEPEQLLVYLIYLANAVWLRLNSCGEVQETSSAELLNSVLLVGCRQPLMCLVDDDTVS